MSETTSQTSQHETAIPTNDEQGRPLWVPNPGNWNNPEASHGQCYSCGSPGVDTCPECGKSVCERCRDLPEDCCLSDATGDQICNCGEPIDGSHDHTTCGPPVRQ